MKTARPIDFAEFRRQAMAAEPLRAMVPLKDVEIHDSEHISVNGVNMSLGRRGMSDLARICGLTSGGTQNMLKVETGAKVIELVKQLSILTKKSKDTKVMIQADNTRNVGRIFSSKSAPRLGHSHFFALVEKYLNTDEFDIASNSYDRNGNLSLTLVRPGLQHQVSGLPDEIFSVGASISMDDAGLVSLTSNNVRKLCDNGLLLMGGYSFKDRQFVKQLWVNTMSEPKGLDEWVGRAAQLKALNYTEPALDDRIKAAARTTASFSEVMAVDAAVRRELFGSPTEDSPVSIAEWSNPGVCTDAYNKKGIHWEGLSGDQRKQLRADRPVWDLINQVTHLASHEVPGLPTLNDASRTSLKMFAGRMLMRGFNLENHMAQQAF